MENKHVVKISVREIIEFILKSGDLSSEYMGSSKAVEGTKAHRFIQKGRPEEYISEVPIIYSIDLKDIYFEISGRIDGIYKYEDRVVIDEIKSTSLSLEYIDEDYNLLHWAQAKCYAYIYADQNQLEDIEVQLTYVNRENQENKSFCKKFSFMELGEFFFNIINKYLDWIGKICKWTDLRDSSIKELEFPFETYRKGQRELAVGVYKTIKTSRKLFVQAPTGIGKTLAVTFPGLKSLGEGHVSKIFYLTAKTITRTAAENAFENLRNKGLKLKTLTITAKEKICFNEGKCKMEECQYASGYFDRINEAVADIFNLDNFNLDNIQEYSRKHMVCPFEYSLELSLWSDCIICDYNYVFDPRVYLKRFFTSGGKDFLFLIDEAHNLVDRAREMFSAELFKKEFLSLKRKTKKELPEIYEVVNKINTFFIEFRKKCDENGEKYLIQSEPLKEINTLIRKFVDKCDSYFESRKKYDFHEDLLDLYFKGVSYIRISEFYDERYITYVEKYSDDAKIKLFCIDPSYLLGEAMKRGKSSIMFSATLTPMDYFSYILGGEREDYKIRIPSPFPQSNLGLLLADNISTRYKNRELSYLKVAELIYSAVRPKKGNYIAYFPSYKYMYDVLENFVSLDSGFDIIYQRPEMGEAEKEAFLGSFIPDRDNTLVGFAVMGGMFGEGIDLAGDRLSGVAIVGVGLPQVCLERDILRQYFQDKNDMGFEYAYIYPGMNKVLQAAGRVIRTENDRGVVLLVDERFSNYNYRELFPDEWSHLKTVRNFKSVERAVKDFWDNE